MSTERYVLLGDVRRSRRIADRMGFRRQLEAACEMVRRAHTDALAAGPSILKGIDEIGAVLTTIAPVYRILTAFHSALAPEGMRFALAAGEVDVGWSSGNVALMDGTAFHEAAGAMERLKHSKLTFSMSVGDPVLDAAIVGQVNLLTIVKDVRTNRQEEVIEQFERSGNQSRTASELRVSQQAVSDVLRRSQYTQVRRLEENVGALFELYARRLEGGEVSG